MNKYNTREKKECPALYRTTIKAEVIDIICEQILRKMIVEKRYRDPSYNAQRLAEEIGTNPRYISAAVSLRFQCNFPELIAGYRLREAISMIESISMMTDNWVSKAPVKAGSGKGEAILEAEREGLIILPRIPEH